MSNLANAANATAYAPLANGPLPKPDGMRGTLIKSISRMSIPATVVCCGVFGLTFYATFYTRLRKIKEHYSTYNPQKEYQEIKEYGVFKSVKASWQE